MIIEFFVCEVNLIQYETTSSFTVFIKQIYMDSEIISLFVITLCYCSIELC